jgi:restriction endonuclease Mrr
LLVVRRGFGRERVRVVDTLASQLKLTEVEREELLPSGKQPVFNNLVRWGSGARVRPVAQGQADKVNIDLEMDRLPACIS